jgi:ADP-ribosylglycohydrolase/protein-tyrosine phosphatase
MTEHLSESARRARRSERAIGAVLASAAGDALGSQYEFGPARADDQPIAFGVGYFGHARGEWTDDTSMAMPILQALSRGDSLNDTSTLGLIVGEWREWSRTSPDVGVQTGSVLGALGGEHSEERARSVARSVHERSRRSGGNGSLMRTGPVALGYLNDGQEDALADAAGRLAQLTHWEDDNVDACVLWCLAIRHAIRTGELGIRAQLAWVPTERRSRWARLIDEALALDAHPRDFRERNGWVVRAFQGALAAIAGARATEGRTEVVDALERAVRGGGDTDTVAAIAGSLAGAVWGATQVPLAWKRILHGWPGLDANELTNLAFLAARGGRPTRDGWPTVPAMPTGGFLHTAPRRHPHDDGVWLGSLSALTELPAEIGAVLSLSRVGTEQVPAGVESIRAWLIDEPGHNANLDWVLAEAADTIAALRAEGTEVFVHCAEARSRTAAVAALYAMRHRGVALEQAWADVAAALPYFAPAQELREAVRRVAAAMVG